MTHLPRRRCRRWRTAWSTTSWRTARLDEGILQLSRPNSRLYGESLQVQNMTVTNDSAPSYIRAGMRSRDQLYPPDFDAWLKVCHYMIQPLVELYGGCMVVLKVS
jgi:hypothetical protein